jgi:uncharacterized membrane protein
MLRSMPWWMFATLSAVAASATAIFAKVGIKDVPSNLATALRTVVVLLFAWQIAEKGPSGLFQQPAQVNIGLVSDEARSRSSRL